VRRREFMALVGGAAAWPLTSRAQQPQMPVVGFLSGRSPSSDAHLMAAFRQGLNETGYIDGQTVAIEFRWADGQLDRLPALAADLVRRQVAVIFAGAVDVQIRALNAAISTVPRPAAIRSSSALAPASTGRAGTPPL
jgi:putative ABC transport system substrate-binding protein